VKERQGDGNFGLTFPNLVATFVLFPLINDDGCYGDGMILIAAMYPACYSIGLGVNRVNWVMSRKGVNIHGYFR